MTTTTKTDTDTDSHGHHPPRRRPAAALLALLPLLAIVIAVIAFAACRKGDDGPQFRLTYSIFFPSTHIHTKLAEQWAEEIKLRTQGRVVIDIYSGAVLSSASENYDCVINGVSDLGMSCFAYTRGLFPLIECLDLPHGYPDGKTATSIANDFINHFQPQELAKTHFLYAHAHGPGILATQNPVQTLADIRGQSIRGTGITAMVINALGANAVGMSQPDTFEALRKGVVNGTLCPMETLKGWKQGEVIKHVTKIPAIGYTTAMFVVMNQKTWEKLPEDIQKTIADVSREWIPKHGQAWDDTDAEGLQFVTELEKTVTTIAPVENLKAAEALEPLFDQWTQEAKQKNLPGLEALVFINNKLGR
ncbi:MAG: TRAP transporter substrate-binding protein [Lentisphaeria bacterium]|nr:TRAP transporter substrate-binding protein [Lentisphaeria bacterium]